MEDNVALAMAAADGIRTYLRSTQGAHRFGAHAEVSVNEKGEVTVLHGHNGVVTHFTPVTM